MSWSSAFISGVLTRAAVFDITVTGTDTFTLDGSDSTGISYSSGGSVMLYSDEPVCIYIEHGANSVQLNGVECDNGKILIRSTQTQMIGGWCVKSASGYNLCAYELVCSSGSDADDLANTMAVGIFFNYAITPIRIYEETGYAFASILKCNISNNIRKDADGVDTYGVAGMAALGFDNGTGTCVSDAVTINSVKGRITTETKTTAAGSTFTITVTNDQAEFTDMLVASIRTIGTLNGTPVISEAKATAGTLTFIVQNIHASAAFNNAFYIDYMLVKGV